MQFAFEPLIDRLLRYPQLIGYLPDGFHTLTNSPIGHTSPKPGVEMYQQPGPVGSQLISKVMSCTHMGTKQ